MSTGTESSAIDTSDIDRYRGQLLARTQAVEPVGVNDVRRWAQAMHHPNPLYYDAAYAAESRFGAIVAPQSFTVVCNVSHGFRPAVQGKIPDSHQLFGGDEWWFYGPRIAPGDRITASQMVYDYRQTDTAFAGPTVIQRGDSHYTNQNGELVALQRSSAIRYIAENARTRRAAAAESAEATVDAGEPDWSDADIDGFTEIKQAYVASIRELGHERRSWDSVEVGDALPTKLVGPHTIVSLTTEWRSFLFNLWNGIETEEFFAPVDTGLTPEMSISAEKAAWDPEFADQAYYGSARGHLFDKYAKRIGMPRAYGYGASMGAWTIDYLTSWAGEWGFLSHVTSQFRNPALVGDVTYLNGTISSKSDAPPRHHGSGLVTVDYAMTDQHGKVMAKGQGDVLLPRD